MVQKKYSKKNHTYVKEPGCLRGLYCSLSLTMGNIKSALSGNPQGSSG